jgi:Ca2+-transporting ATPase
MMATGDQPETAGSIGRKVGLVTDDKNHIGGGDTDRAVTVSFLTLVFARLWHVFNMRARCTSLIHNPITTNPFIWGALMLCTALLLSGIYVPGLSLVQDMVDPGTDGWMLIVGFSLMPLISGQIAKAIPVAGRARNNEGHLNFNVPPKRDPD